MSRKRRDRIDESAEELAELEMRHRGTPRELRLRMLRLMKMEDQLTIAQVAEIIGCSERTAHRWWGHYRKWGMEGLLDTDGTHRPPSGASRVAGSEAEELARRLRSGDFQTLYDIQEWLRARMGINYSIRNISDLVEDQLRPRRLLQFETDSAERGRAEIREAYAEPESTPSVSEPMLVFFRSLPLSGGVTEWIDAFRGALKLLLREVDWITVSVNIDCNLQTLDPPSPRAIMSDHRPDGEQGRVPAEAPPERLHADRLVEEVRRDRFPIESYHPPLSFVYYYSNDAYLGTIVIWREGGRSPISTRTIEAMRGLESVVIFLLSGCVARYQSDRPVDSHFQEALLRIVREGGLSSQEKRIMILQLLGHSYREIADILAISIDTVGKHVNAIHRKTETRSFGELFAKYFTTRLDSAL